MALSAPNRGIANLGGLEYAGNLGLLHLTGNSISDLGPLAALQHLTYLDVAQNPVTISAPWPDCPISAASPSTRRLSSTSRRWVHCRHCAT